MNIKRIQSTVALASAAILSLGVALPAAAQTYGTGSVTGAVNTATQAAVGANAGASVNVGLSGNASTSDSTSGGSGSTSASGNLGASVSVTPIVVTRADVASNAVTPSSESAAQVQSNTDLSGYIAAQIQNDSNVSQVQASPSNVSVGYKESAKLFGFIPVSATVTAMTDANGNVTVSYPWWAFLATTEKSDLQTKLQAQVSADLGGNASAQASGQLSASQQAQLVSDMRTVMQSELNAAANANANSNANVNVGSGASY